MSSPSRSHEARGVIEVLPLVVRTIAATWCEVNCCPVFASARAEGLVVLGRILDDPAAEVQFKQKKLKFLIGVPLQVSVRPCRGERYGENRNCDFSFPQAHFLPIWGSR
jgi:hypothetical protein